MGDRTPGDPKTMHLRFAESRTAFRYVQDGSCVFDLTNDRDWVRYVAARG
jgi:hypothetical protein